MNNVRNPRQPYAEPMTGDEPNAGPEVKFYPRWGFVVGPRDALLILRGLRGALGTNSSTEAAEREMTEAIALCDRLTLLREAAARGTYDALDRAADAVESKGAGA